MSLKSNNGFSYASLPMACKNIASAVVRDIEEFNKYGVSIEDIEQFALKIEEHINMETDEEYRAEINVASRIKNELADKLRNQIRILIIGLRLNYKNYKDLRKRLEVKNIYQQSDLKLKETVEKVILVFRDILVNLENNELLENGVNTLEQINNEFDTALQNQIKYKEERKAASYKRRKLANELYEQASTYAELGKVIWANDVRYKHYVLRRKL